MSHPTPQSTKKIEEKIEQAVLNHATVRIQGERLTCFTNRGLFELQTEFLTILKETCEAALPRKATIDKENEYIANYINIGFNDAIDQTKANLTQLIGEDR